MEVSRGHIDRGLEPRLKIKNILTFPYISFQRNKKSEHILTSRYISFERNKKNITYIQTGYMSEVTETGHMSEVIETEHMCPEVIQTGYRSSRSYRSPGVTQVNRQGRLICYQWSHGHDRSQTGAGHQGSHRDVQIIKVRQALYTSPGVIQIGHRSTEVIQTGSMA